LADGWAAYHQWTPIPARRAGKLGLISKSNTDKDFWIRGLAFSKNPWGHAAQSAVGYHWAVNGGSATGWSEPNWNSDSLAYIPSKTQLVLKVPVVPSGRDKLLYLIEHNSNWNGASHTAISVGGKPIERFMATIILSAVIGIASPMSATSPPVFQKTIFPPMFATSM
jgi:hypothetical protein